MAELSAKVVSYLSPDFYAVHPIEVHDEAPLDRYRSTIPRSGPSSRSQRYAVVGRPLDQGRQLLLGFGLDDTIWCGVAHQRFDQAWDGCNVVAIEESLGFKEFVSGAKGQQKKPEV